MGKPTFPMRPGDDAMSLHSQHNGDRSLDDDAPELQVDDLPPLYDDVASDLPYTDAGEGSSSSAPLLLPTRSAIPGEGPYTLHKTDASSGVEFFLDSRFDTEPKFLERHVNLWAQTPPRPFARLHGTHSQQVDKDGKKERQTVTDFDVKIELTPYLFSDPVNRVAMRELRTVDNTEKVHRGTILSKRAPGTAQNIEVGAIKPTLEEWCHRYVACHATLKGFLLQRRVVGFDEEKVRQKLTALVRDTNYRGHLEVTFPMQDATVQVFNDARINRWRLTPWIVWMCIFTLMFLFTWPFLFFATKRFEVVTADWAYSVVGEDGRKKYVSISEDQWYNLWGRAINRAVLEKRQSTLQQQDLLSGEGAPPVFGHAAVDGAMNLFRASVTAMNEVNRQLGWGGNC